MLKDNILLLSQYYGLEILQSRDEGKDVSNSNSRMNEIETCSKGDDKENLSGCFVDELYTRPILNTYPYFEPSDFNGIQQERPIYNDYSSMARNSLSDDLLYDKIYGAWLGRCVGCLLGQPVEFWPRERLYGLLRDTNNFPVNFYISSDIDNELREKYKVTDIGNNYDSNVVNWINNVQYMPEDDDINYVILALKILEKYGLKFTSDNVAERWLMDLPILHVFCGERIAYRNITNGIFPPKSAMYRNPFRESLGAQIRGDFYGYINPGDPKTASEMAWKDANLSHVKNGIYGEMFISAMLSAAAVISNVDEVIRCGLSQIPRASRLTNAINSLFEWKNLGITLHEVINKIHQLYDEEEPYAQLHTIPNAMVVCAGLLYGENDFEKSLSGTLLGSFDKDCNCATVGSIMGMILGAKFLPEKWIKPLHNQVKSGVDGFGLVNISDLAYRTFQICKLSQKKFD